MNRRQDFFRMMRDLRLSYRDLLQRYKEVELVIWINNPNGHENGQFHLYRDLNCSRFRIRNLRSEGSEYFWVHWTDVYKQLGGAL